MDDDAGFSILFPEWVTSTERYRIISRKQRSRTSGMRWTADIAEAICQLRAISLNGNFDRYWTFHIAKDQQRLHPGDWSVVLKYPHPFRLLSERNLPLPVWRRTLEPAGKHKFTRTRGGKHGGPDPRSKQASLMSRTNRSHGLSQMARNQPRSRSRVMAKHQNVVYCSRIQMSGVGA